MPYHTFWNFTLSNFTIKNAPSTQFIIGSDNPINNDYNNWIVCSDQRYLSIALNKTAFQSSTAHGGVASRAVDGKKNTMWAGNSCTHTGSRYTTNDEWLYVDLGYNFNIQRVVVHGGMLFRYDNTYKIIELMVMGPWRLCIESVLSSTPLKFYSSTFKLVIEYLASISPIYQSIFYVCSIVKKLSTYPLTILKGTILSTFFYQSIVVNSVPASLRTFWNICF